MNKDQNIYHQLPPGHPETDPSTPEKPYDTPESYNASDSAMDNMFDSRPQSADSGRTRVGEYSSVNSPTSKVEMHDHSDSSDPEAQNDRHRHHHHHHHAKRFDQKSTRRELFKTGSLMLLITIVFVVAFCMTVKSFEGYKTPVVLSKHDLRWFNAITIGLSLCLGINLLASLQDYTSFLRWTFLSRRYISLETFELILGLENLMSVIKLMFISMPFLRNQRWLGMFSWYKDMRSNPSNWTWLACLAWLLVNIGSQILVALVSLFYPTTASHIPLMVHGDVAVADLTYWHPQMNDNGNATGLEAAWMFGMEAMVYPEFFHNETKTDLSALSGTPIYKGDGYWEYRFFNRDPELPFKNYYESPRKIHATATCEQIEVRGTFFQDDNNYMYIEGRDSITNEWIDYGIPERIAGAMTWIASVPESCGARCTNYTVLQSKDSSVIMSPSLFLCNNTISDVIQGTAKYEVKLTHEEEKQRVYGTDEFARTAAGAIGWTGVDFNDWGERQARSYTQGSKWSPAHSVGVNEVENMLMRFTIGSIAAFDDHGIRFHVPEQTVRPQPGTELEVDWVYIVAIMGSIIFIQAAALGCLVFCANRAIVRDSSAFSMAMLLSPVVSRIGKAGMNMSGEEIKDHPKLKFKKIRYDYREGVNGEPNQVDIFFEGKDTKEIKKWVPGVYS